MQGERTWGSSSTRPWLRAQSNNVNLSLSLDKNSMKEGHPANCFGPRFCVGGKEARRGGDVKIFLSQKNDRNFFHFISPNFFSPVGENGTTLPSASISAPRTIKKAPPATSKNDGRHRGGHRRCSRSSTLQQQEGEARLHPRGLLRGESFWLYARLNFNPARPPPQEINPSPLLFCC